MLTHSLCRILSHRERLDNNTMGSMSMRETGTRQVGGWWCWQLLSLLLWRLLNEMLLLWLRLLWLKTFNTTSQAEAGLTYTHTHTSRRESEWVRERERDLVIGLASCSIRLKPYFIHTQLLNSTAAIFFVVVPFIRKGVINFPVLLFLLLLLAVMFTHTHIYIHLWVCVHFFFWSFLVKAGFYQLLPLISLKFVLNLSAFSVVCARFLIAFHVKLKLFPP